MLKSSMSLICVIFPYCYLSIDKLSQKDRKICVIGATAQELQTSRDLKWEITGGREGGSGDWRGNNELQVKRKLER